MSKQTKIILIILGLILVGGGLLAINILNNNNNNNQQQPIGGETDEHGCLVAAGYSWCQDKNKCLRIWEEPCYTSVEQEIQHLLANKYQKSADEVSVHVTKKDETHAAGSVAFGPPGTPGGLFLAVKSGNVWELVFDGNGSIDCAKMKQEYQFPDEILKPEFCD